MGKPKVTPDNHLLLMIMINTAGGVCRRHFVEYVGVNIQKRHFPRQPWTTAAVRPLRWASSSQTVVIEDTPNDKLLRKVFDDHRFYEKFRGSKDTNSGLFRNSWTTSVRQFPKFADSSLERAHSLVESIVNARTTQQRVQIVKRLDQLSDILCRVIDLCEFVRVVHPTSKYVIMAQETHEKMFEFMNQLNTHVPLYEALRDTLEDPQLTKLMTKEEIKVGEYLKQDFERSGINMDPTTRDNFVSITNEISVLGSQFSEQVRLMAHRECKVPKWAVDEMKNINLKNEIISYQSMFKDTQDHYVIPFHLNVPFKILNECDSREVRKQVWIGLHDTVPEQVAVLEAFLKYRAVLANMLGYRSFADYQLEYKMAKTPENVQTLLKNLQESLHCGVQGELAQLCVDLDIEIRDVKPWDRDYLVYLLEQKQLRANIDKWNNLPSINEYFSVGNVMVGLNKLFTQLYGISLIPVPTCTGETWKENQVRKILVFDIETQQTLGFLYVDFWSSKVLPSHFTIVCSRQLNTDIGSESLEELTKEVQLDGDYQLPVIALVCNFAVYDNSDPTLLSFDQVDTLFHEMGHAMHSMIGRTNLHNLSGTRCATDFVELPSVLMEFFSKDPRVLMMMGRHYKTGEPLSETLLSLHKQKLSVGSLQQCEKFVQSKMAILDQALHNDQVIHHLEDFDPVNVYHNLEQQSKVFPDTYSTWLGKIPHLFSYGAVYYLYLLDLTIAEKIWNQLFAAEPFSRQAGDKYKQSVLVWGGTRDPWECLSDALDTPELSRGDSHAIEIIASK